ncbi:coilin isoform X2 [Cyprinodon tularosa]|uniref:coilin isoform X2 n=1 Tax=Cyprinodon tularosa TaxID=77115 RepID=UPI0018E20079|nr:coilin isoform X2 [Cyprinodon tularosa]
MMSAHSSKLIRLRVLFDYPPPACAGCRMCWLLVDLNTCRVVADLESIIRERFEFSRSSILSLFIEDCYLPHTESIYVVRDSDSIRVKVECLPQLNGHSSCPETPNGNWRKRRRDTAEDGPGDGAGSAHKKKKKTKKLEDGTTEGTNLAKVDGRNKTSETKKALKKKKKTRLSVASSHAAAPKASAAPHKPSAPKKMAAVKTSKAKAPSSDSSSSDEETIRQQKPTAAPKGPPKLKNPQPSSSSSSSSETDSPSAVAPSSSGPKAPPVAPQSADGASSNREPPRSAAPEPHVQDDEEEEIQLVIRRPQQPFLNIPRRGPGRGARDGPGAERPGWRGQRDAQSCTNGTTTPSVQKDVLTNKSVVFQNEAEQAPLKDYSSMPLLAAPPQVGQKIAFKLLELTENYTPEVSEYKEGKIVNFDPTSKQIELELLNASPAPSEPGKFDLVYQNPDGSERVEYAVQRGSTVMERWDSLLEPRLIIET